jgi:SAM-dependent methyltransferase
MDKLERQRAHFNSIAERYQTARKGVNHLLLKDLIWADFLGPHPELKRDGLQVLEAMCGFGDGKTILEGTLGVELDYSGFDYSDEVIARVRKDKPELAIFHGDVGSIELDRQFDLILLLGGLHHVPQIADAALRRLVAAIRPGGLFISLEPTSGNRLFSKVRDWVYSRNSLFDEQTEQGFTVEEVLTLFHDAGLEEVDLVFPGLLAYVLYYNPDAFPWLNLGGPRTVRALYRVDRLFLRNRIGRALSFATLSLWRRPLESAAARER